jgi:oxygen-dependent protoporphyrinogen oxidase
MKQIAIIGAGIAGLSMAYYLSKLSQQGGRRLQIMLLEKEGRLGGSIQSEKEDGFLMEAGPDCFISEKPWALHLCRELGIEGEVINTNQEFRRTFILLKGKLHEIPEGFMLLAPTSLMPFIKSSLFSIPGKMRMGLDLILPRKKADGEESLAEFVLRRLGKEALERIAEPLVAGIHAGDPTFMSLKSTFPRFIDLEREYRSLIWGMYKRKRQFAHLSPRHTVFVALRQGMGQLISTLEKALPADIISRREEAARLEKITSKSANKPPYLLHIKGKKKLVEADCVVLATPAFVSARIARKLDNDVARVLDTIPYCSTATINLAYERSQIDHPLHGYGFVVPSLEKRNIMGTTFSTVKFANRSPKGKVLLRCFVGGARNEAIVSWKDTKLLAAVKKDIEQILKIQGEPSLTRIFRWPKAMPQYTLGHEERVSNIEQGLTRYPGIFVTGSAYHGVGISDCVHEADQLAEQIIKFIKNKR